MSAAWLVLREPLLQALYDGRFPWVGLSGPDGSPPPRRVGYYLERADYRVAWSLLSAWVVLGTAWMTVAPMRAAVGFAAGTAIVSVAIGAHPLIEVLVVGESRSVVDTLTAPIALAASLLFVAVAVRGARCPKTLMVIAVLFFVVAGEESSWLQHTLEYKTPLAVRRLNEQREFNVHNLSTQVFDATFQVVMAFLFLALPAMRRDERNSARALRLWGVGFALYFATRVAMLSPNEQAFTAWFFRLAAIATTCVALMGPRLLLRGRPGRTIAWLRDTLAPHRDILGPSALLFATWIAYGLRFQCLGDLQWGRRPWPANMDGELLELFVALLAVGLAGGMLRSPRVRPSTARVVRALSKAS